MRAFSRMGLLLVVVWLQLSGVSLAKQVFLRDGSVLDCQSFWKHNNEIVVKVNRDVILQFEPAEVDLGKTFHKTRKSPPVKRKHRADKKHALSPAAPAAGATATAAPIAAASGTTKPLPPAAPANAQASAPAPTAKQPATKPASSGPNPAASAPVAAPAAAAPATPAPAANPPAAQPAAKESTPAESAPATSAGPAPAQPLSKEELQRRTQENTKMIADAIRNNDPELMKKAVEAQKNLIQQQQQQLSGGALSGGAKGKGEPPWFKYFLMLVASCLFMIIGMWVVFQKAGESGFKSIIPIYNYYVLIQISGKPGWWLAVIMFVPVVGLALYLLTMLSLAEKFNRSPVFGIGLTFLPMIFFPLLAFGGSQYAETTVHEELDFTFSEEPPLA